MEIDWQFKVGLAVGIISVLLPFAVKDMPHWITWPGLSVGFLFLVWAFLPAETKQAVGPALVTIAGIAITIAGLSWYIDVLYGDDKQPNISFQKFALFWVKLDEDIYEIGVVAKFVNLDDRTYLLNGMIFEAISWGFFSQRELPNSLVCGLS
jgi:hypothetical protein